MCIYTGWVQNNPESTLIQLMAWRRQATMHYLSQSLRSSMSPNGVTMPQWVLLSPAVLWRYLMLQRLKLLHQHNKKDFV